MAVLWSKGQNFPSAVVSSCPNRSVSTKRSGASNFSVANSCLFRSRFGRQAAYGKALRAGTGRASSKLAIFSPLRTRHPSPRQTGPSLWYLGLPHQIALSRGPETWCRRYRTCRVPESSCLTYLPQGPETGGCPIRTECLRQM